MPQRDHGLGRPVAQSADPIDRVVRLAPKWTVFVLIACGLLVLGIIIWAVRGTVTSSVSTPGLYNERGAASVVTDAHGDCRQGAGQASGSRSPPASSSSAWSAVTALVSPQDGSVTSILVSDGSAMCAGQARRAGDRPGGARLRGDDGAGQHDGHGGRRVCRSGWRCPARRRRSTGTCSAPSTRSAPTPSPSPRWPSRLGLEEEVVAAQLGTEPGLLAMVRLDPTRAPCRSTAGASGRVRPSPSPRACRSPRRSS